MDGRIGGLFFWILGVGFDRRERKLRDVVGQMFDLRRGVCVIGIKPANHFVGVTIKATLAGDAEGAIADDVFVGIGAQQFCDD